MLYHKADFNCTCDWNFFATAHGKGPVDDIGGETNRSVWRKVLKGNGVVNTALEIYEVVKKQNNTINVLYVIQIK